MIEILESVRRIVYRWVNTNIALTADAPYNSKTLKVVTSIRFKEGDEVALHNGVDGEPNLRIAKIVDETTIELETPIKVITGWRVSNNAMLTKTYNGQFVQAIYISEPEVIPRYPAITILGKSRSSEWLSLGTTKERYELQLGIYSMADNAEESYRTVLQLSDLIQKGLKRNIYPLIGGVSTNVIADVAPLVGYIKVADSSIFRANDALVLENKFYAEEVRVKCIIDSTTIQIHPNNYYFYRAQDGTKLIKIDRFIFNSWPNSVEYGVRYKESLLHAATISWFAEEQETQVMHGWSDPQTS